MKERGGKFCFKEMKWREKTETAAWLEDVRAPGVRYPSENFYFSSRLYFLKFSNLNLKSEKQ